MSIQRARTRILNSQRRISQQDRDEFRAYLHNCTDAQVRGVLEKERKANRRAYVNMAMAEASRRGLVEA